jgi:hypothetical protein
MHRAMSGDSRYAVLRALLDYDGDRDADNADYYQFRLGYGLRMP